MCIKSFVGWGFYPNPTGGAYSAPQTRSWFRGRMEPPGRGEKGKGEGKGKGKRGRGMKRKKGKRKGKRPPDSISCDHFLYGVSRKFHYTETALSCIYAHLINEINSKKIFVCLFDNLSAALNRIIFTTNFFLESNCYIEVMLSKI